MKILLFTNTYLPHVGGVARSVHTLEEACRERGHQVRVIAPKFEGAAPSPHVLRVPAIQNFNGSDFSVRIPMPNVIGDFIEDFVPDVVHSHHPFLLGDAALRVVRLLRVPLVFTHHTLYERYTHYVPFDSPSMKRIAISLATEYCNMCDAVIAPSQSVAKLLEERGVETVVRPIPTGIDLEAFGSGDGLRLREKLGIPEKASLIGTVGRVAHEKNLPFLATAAAVYLQKNPDAGFAADCSRHARETAQGYSTESCTRQVLDYYEETIRIMAEIAKTEDDFDGWDRFVESIENEWHMLAAKLTALSATTEKSRATEAKLV